MTEAQEQMNLMRWAMHKRVEVEALDMLFHVPNGGARTASAGARMKKMGVRRGVPDLFLAVPSAGYAGLFIEMKRESGGSLTEHQEEWLEKLDTRGFQAVECHGWQEARKVILEYLDEPDDWK